MIKSNNIHIRQMNQHDFEQMYKWLNDPLILEFYGESPVSLSQVIDKYLPRVEGLNYVFPCIVEYENRSIGYIQFYKIQESDLKEYGYPLEQTIYGIDQFIGETALFGKGIGTSMILMILDFLRIEKNATQVLLDVKATNSRAISCYKKCGFKTIKPLDHDQLLMGRSL